MYFKSQLDGFANQIADEQKAAEFRRVASLIQFDKDGICFGGAVEEAFRGSATDDLRREFELRHLEFLTQADLEKILTHKS